MTKHTSGPFIAWDDGRTIGIISDDGEPIAIAEIVDHGDMADEGQLRADQALFSASYDMLRALQAVDMWLRGYGTKSKHEILAEYVYPAIAKAGASPHS